MHLGVLQQHVQNVILRGMIEPDAQIVISVEFVEFGSLLAVVQSLKLDQARTSLVGGLVHG